MIPRRTLLGEQTAEYDSAFLHSNFIETPEYRSIIETKDSTVVVGRRGTGKSAMFSRLQKLWGTQRGANVIAIAPQDYQTISFRSIFRGLETNYNHVRAASRLVWKYSLLLEMLSNLARHYKSQERLAGFSRIQEELKYWQLNTNDFFGRMTNRLSPLLRKEKNSEDIIVELPQILKIDELEKAFDFVFEKSPIRFYILIDRLDEGYENDEAGAAIISGAISVISDLNKKYERIRPVIFQRDNIIRSVQKYDPDYTRNIEGEVLSLHWGTHLLQNLVAKRLNSVFKLNIEKSQRIWDHCVADEGAGRELKGMDGFKKCLRFTLYRPRDILSLLNQAFYTAMKDGRERIVYGDIESTAKTISRNRLDDLKKEYKSTFPSLIIAISLFESGNPEMGYLHAHALLDHMESYLKASDSSPEIVQDYQFLKNDGLIRVLYSIGFLGIHDKNSNTFTFCHDGRQHDRDLSSSERLLVHPCYWMALNLSKNALLPEEVEQINDEYEINVVSISPEIRAKRIEALRMELSSIEEGREHANIFQDWVKKVIEVVFAGHLSNIENSPNGAAVQRRDVVGTNRATTSAWKRIREDYDVRQVVFDAKNYKTMGADEYRQMASYLHDQYGKLGFLVTRDEDDNLRAGAELDHTREMYRNEKKLIIRLSCNFFLRMLNKLRNPEKHDVVDSALSKMLDKYERTYLSTPSTRKRKDA